MDSITKGMPFTIRFYGTGKSITLNSTVTNTHYCLYCKWSRALQTRCAVHGLIEIPEALKICEKANE